jgi:hypothetical protein
LKKTEDDLSDSEVEGEGGNEQKDPELPAKRNETVNNKKALKQISKLKSWFHPDPVGARFWKGLGS